MGKRRSGYVSLTAAQRQALIDAVVKGALTNWEFTERLTEQTSASLLAGLEKLKRSRERTAA